MPLFCQSWHCCAPRTISSIMRIPRRASEILSLSGSDIGEYIWQKSLVSQATLDGIHSNADTVCESQFIYCWVYLYTSTYTQIWHRAQHGHNRLCVSVCVAQGVSGSRAGVGGYARVTPNKWHWWIDDHQCVTLSIMTLPSVVFCIAHNMKLIVPISTPI